MLRQSRANDSELDPKLLVVRIAELERRLITSESTNSDNLKLQSILKDSLAYVESILDTVREPVLVLEASLHVKTASRSFYRTFNVSAEETVGRFVYDLGNGQWSTPALRALLEEILPQHTTIQDLEIGHEVPELGRRVMLLNARKLWRASNNTEHILGSRGATPSARPQWGSVFQQRSGPG